MLEKGNNETIFRNKQVLDVLREIFKRERRKMTFYFTINEIFNNISASTRRVIRNV